ncbi:MAG: glycine betaine ABC transporter substrate-binding protein [Rhodanobacteraceae bacterium]
MQNLRKLAKPMIASLILGSLALAGCSGGGNEGTTTQGPSDSSAMSAASAPASPAPMQEKTASAAGGSINLVYVEWSSCVASTEVIKAVLESRGYDVKTTSVSAAALYAAIAGGDADATVCAWLPTTHKNYYAKTKDRLDNLGPNLNKGTRLGLVVPDYVTIDSIADLSANADKFQNRIIGIDPGAGEMGLTQDVVKQYDLPLKLVSGSGATMTAALKSAIDSKQWVVVTGWSPHWMWARWDLKYLDDPKGVYGEPDSIDTLARKGLKQDMPGAYAILDAYQWTAKQMEQVMAMNQKDGTTPEDNARQWIKDHPEAVQSWTSGS